MSYIKDDDPIYRAIAKMRKAEIEGAKRASQATTPDPLGALSGDYAEKALTVYAFITTQVKGLAQAKGGNRAVTDVRRAWPRLVTARLFAIPEDAYISVRNWADRHTTEVVAKVPWRPRPPGATGAPEAPEAEVDAWLKAMHEAVAVQPLPEHLPFNETLLIYGGGALLSEGDTVCALGREAAKDYDHIRLLADLVCADGTVWQFCLGVGHNADVGLFFQQIRGADGWASGLNLAPWIIPGVIDLVNSFKKLVHEQPRSLSFRKRWEKYQKNAIRLNGRGLLHPIPPPFYRVDLQQELVTERVNERAKAMSRAHRTWQLQHRCDVRGHERIRLARGKLPLPPEVQADLLERNYKVFTHNPVDADTARLMVERHERPKSHDEWLAIKVSWVKPHQRGPEGAPYVPALRVLPDP